MPDVTIIYNSVYIGLELKLPKGTLTKHQKETLPEFNVNKVIYFIIENVIDLFDAMESIKENIINNDLGVIIKKDIYNLSERQLYYRKKYKL